MMEKYTYSQPRFATFVLLIVIGTAVVGLISVVITVIIIAYGVANFRATADFVVRISSAGASRVNQIASSLVTQAKAIVQSIVPIVEQAATDVSNIVVNGVTFSLNTILAVGEGLADIIIDSFITLVNLTSDLGQALAQTFSDVVGPMFDSLHVNLQMVGEGAAVMVEMFNSINDIALKVIDIFGSFTFTNPF